MPLKVVPRRDRKLHRLVKRGEILFLKRGISSFGQGLRRGVCRQFGAIAGDGAQITVLDGAGITLLSLPLKPEAGGSVDQETP